MDWKQHTNQRRYIIVVSLVVKCKNFEGITTLFISFLERNWFVHGAYTTYTTYVSTYTGGLKKVMRDWQSAHWIYCRVIGF